MRIDNGKYQLEKRKKRLFTPTIYMFFEIILIYLLLSIANISFAIESWSTLSHILFTMSTLYSGYKTYGIYERQKEYKPA